jgi:2-hydroxychromene-2-carboxylate isomerase
MSLKSLISTRVSAHLTSEARLLGLRQRAERKRLAAGAPHVVEYFHQADDPYCQLTASVLEPLLARYRIELRPWLVSSPPDWAAPERARLVAYSRTDASRLAARAGISFRDPGAQPDPAAVAAAEAALAARIADGSFVRSAARIGAALWQGTPPDPALSDLPVTARAAADAVAAGDQRRQAAGHYLAATFFYGGEWYWGLDRLHHLEARLAELDARRPEAPAQPLYAPPPVPAAGGAADDGATAAAAGSTGSQQTLHFYLSFRSPYTYIATARVQALAAAHGATLALRFVLPMVMRGLPVPAAKRSYIVADVAREARYLGVPFGRVADPVGRPVERGYTLLPWALDQGRGYEYCLAFMRGVWAEGVDAGSNRGLARIVAAAGLDWSTARGLLRDPQADARWRGMAEANRQEMLNLGLWGVPAFRVGDVATWGQDRLWVADEALTAPSGRAPDNGSTA